ncbi:unnamed protein product [Rotaria sp. Silwood2]|nr:unnamed protein product [Rotaria sp. Silwood2]
MEMDFWQTRGFQSKYGTVAILSCNTTPKVLDIEICSKTYALAMKESNPNKYNEIIGSHRCEEAVSAIPCGIKNVKHDETAITN